MRDGEFLRPYLPVRRSISTSAMIATTAPERWA
jgi:hypothetical protein